MAAAEQRIIITKDADFVSSFHLKGEPRQLLLISTGNLSNADIFALFIPNLSAIASAFDSASLVELTRSTLITRN